MSMKFREGEEKRRKNQRQNSRWWKIRGRVEDSNMGAERRK